MILLKVIKVENAWFVTFGLLIMDSKFKIMYAMVVMIWQCLIFSISDIAIITVTNVDYRCIIYNISKSAANNSLKSSVFENRGYM